MRNVLIILTLAGGLPPLASAEDRIDFVRDVQPILEAHCTDCHGPDLQESGLRLDRRTSMLQGGDYGLPAIVPGEPEKSFLLDVVQHKDPDLTMPPDEEQLSPDKIALLSRWIEAGAPWPGQMDEVAPTKSDHWSLQPLVRPEAPRPADPARARNAIDAFLQQELAAQGLTFSDAADPRTLIRRVSVVLTGLPPTPEQTAAFIEAYRAQPAAAYAALVERLLASPHFGERWAQHWLDAIRWAETNGSESNLYRKNAWIYRDYVVRSFNEDKPYDQFVREQIAGDVLGADEATGFLVAGPHVPPATVGREPAAIRQARADRLDETLQTVGASVMGMTVGCARCHNHKFDPISIHDYYAMTAVFQDIEYGSRFPQYAPDDPRRKRSEQLWQQVSACRQRLAAAGAWQEDWGGYRELHFAPIRTKVLRLSFQKPWVRIDELEVFGPEEPRGNFALASRGTTTQVDPQLESPEAQVRYINDGEYGTMAWAPLKKPEQGLRPWVELVFDSPQTIDRIRVSTNRVHYWETDYLQKANSVNVPDYRVESRAADGTWTLVASTNQIQRQLRSEPTSEAAHVELQRLIALLAHEGPQRSFIGRFVAPAPTFVLHRGDPESPRDKVAPAGLAELDGDLGLTFDAAGPERRLAFAQWLTRPDHPLTARVMANRLWHHVFGRGIVSTPSDFGAAGAPPTHPALLDWLAAEFISPSDGGAPRWSVKHLVRMMVMSHAFRQASRPTENQQAADAPAALLWRFPPRRVEAEVIRDSILQASGNLDRSIGGRGYRIHNVKKIFAQWEVVDNHGPLTWRRMLYQERMRRVDDRLFTAFDFPDCGQLRGQRTVSTTPLQALNLLNSTFVVEQANLIAERAGRRSPDDVRGAVRECFQLLLARDPTAEEQRASLAVARRDGLGVVCRALMNSNEFVFLP